MALIRSIILGVVLLFGGLSRATFAQQEPGELEITVSASEASGAPAAEKIKLYSSSKALIIGIDNYSAGWPRLGMAIKDAEAVAAAMKLQGFDVTLVKDPTAAELERAFQEFFIANGTDPEARLFFWFAGHGHTIKSGGGDDEGYIVPKDAPSPAKSDAAFRLKALSLRRFGEYMREARAKHVLAVFDSCFGGTVFNVARALPPAAITRAITLPVRQFISSGDADQVVSDDGTFRRLFIDALQGAEPSADANRDGYLTGTGLGQFLYNKVTNFSNGQQTPRYGKLNARGYDRGDFVFEVRQPKGGVAAAKPPAAEPQPPLSEAAQAWKEIKERTDVRVFKAFRDQFGKANPLYDTLAEQRIAELTPAQAPIANALNTAPKPLEGSCDGLLVSVAQSSVRPCIKPGSGQSFKDCLDCPEMVVLPAGSFLMGSPEGEAGRYPDEVPQHQVTIAEPFAVGRTHVTRGQFAKFVTATGHETDGGCWTLSGTEWKENKTASWRSPGFEQSDNHPVVCMNWNDAATYAAWLAKTTGQPYRLLSEAEAEYATRGVTKPTAQPRYFFGDDETALCKYANGLDETAKASGKTPSSWTYSSCKDRYIVTAPVMSFKPNAFGVYDVHGNAWTWTEDCYSANYQAAPNDGSAKTTGDCSRRVLRGGSWVSFPRHLRSAVRVGFNPDNRFSDNGFRLARTLNPAP